MCGSRKYPHLSLLMDGYWKFQGGGGSQKPKFLKESMKLNWDFQRGGVRWDQTKRPPVVGRGMAIFWHHTIPNKLLTIMEGSLFTIFLWSSPNDSITRTGQQETHGHHTEVVFHILNTTKLVSKQ